MNLSLLVGPLRGDGYHDLFTVFAPLDLFDDLECRLRLSPGGAVSSVEVDLPGVPSDENLITRAFGLLAGQTGWSFGGQVGVAKRIPIGAGLGGGSSDAACALMLGARALLESGGPSVPPDVLSGLALRLGADVPFFLDPRTSTAKGVGDLLEPLLLPRCAVVVILPEKPLLTAEVYRTFDGVAAAESPEAWENRRRLVEGAWLSLAATCSSREAGMAAACLQIAGLLYNDLERAAFHLLPELTSLKARLEREGVLGAMLSGSGPTLFGICSSEEEADTIATALRAEGLPARRCLAGDSS